MSFFNVFDREKSAQQGSSEAAEAQLNANVSGRVQGVGFRWWTKGEATPLGLVGYAKNLDDGSVEIVAQGSRENCQKLLDTLRSGNTAGHVDHVDAEITDPQGSYRDFGTY